MTLQECQEYTTSTEFLEWCIVLDEEEQKDLDVPSKMDYYLAQIAAEIRRVGVMFSSSKRNVPVDELLIKFEKTIPQAKAAPQAKAVPQAKKGIEIGEPLDDHWKAVNVRARASWGMMLGKKE